MHGEADARESGRLEWTLNDDDDDLRSVILSKLLFSSASTVFVTEVLKVSDSL